MPGLVDVHTHLREPGFEYKEDVESGTRAAAHGGFTAVCAMPNTNPVCDEGAAVRFLVERAAERGKVRVYPIGALTVGLKGEALAEMGDMVAEGAVAFSDDGKGVQDAGTMRRVMDYARAFGTTVVAHCEDEALVGKGVVNEGAVSTRLGMAGWPAAGEEIAVARDIALAELTGCRLHLAHVSTAGALELVRAAKERGVAVTCEVTPHHLFLTEDDLTPGLRHQLQDEPAAAHRSRPRRRWSPGWSTAPWTASRPTTRRTRRTRRRSSSSWRRSARPGSRRRCRWSSPTWSRAG